MFMKTDMMGDIHAMRFNVKTSITKVRGTVAKKHTRRRLKIQFMIIIRTQKRKT
jgi:head-tail adaptor